MIARNIDRAFDAACGTQLATRGRAHQILRRATTRPCLTCSSMDVDIGAIDVGIPDPFGIDHDHGTFLAPIETPCLVDADLALACQIEFLDPFLGVVAQPEAPLALQEGRVSSRWLQQKKTCRS